MTLVPRRVAVRLPRERTTRVFRAFGWLAVRFAQLVAKPDWAGEQHIPRSGGVLVVSNHISNADPVELGNFLISGARRWPYFIGKADIWRVPGLGWLARACGQIPVERNSPTAKNVVQAADAEVQRGKVVCIYPEGTITGDPEGWPMEPRTGAARIALETGCPVIPVGQWGAQRILPGKKLTYPRLFPRATFTVRAGAPIPLDDLRALPVTREVLQEASRRIIEAVTAQVELARGESAPETRFDLRTGERHARQVAQA